MKAARTTVVYNMCTRTYCTFLGLKSFLLVLSPQIIVRTVSTMYHIHLYRYRLYVHTKCTCITVECSWWRTACVHAVEKYCKSILLEPHASFFLLLHWFVMNFFVFFLVNDPLFIFHSLKIKGYYPKNI